MGDGAVPRRAVAAADLLEGEPGVGKTEAAKALARVLDTPLYRLQCYEEIDSGEALYEWNYPRQLLGILLAEARNVATHPPIVSLTSNRTRDLHDALTRRCLYHWIDYPGPERIAEIVRRRVPNSVGRIALEAASTVTRLRSLDMAKPPGIAEAIDWVSALTALGVDRLDEATVDQTWGSVLKNRDDLDLASSRGAAWLVGERG